MGRAAYGFYNRGYVFDGPAAVPDGSHGNRKRTYALPIDVRTFLLARLMLLRYGVVDPHEVLLSASVTVRHPPIVSGKAIPRHRTTWR